VIQLNQKNFVSIVKKVLDETGLNPQYLTLEITESILIKSLEANIKKLEELKELGVKIALDDFGKGYSSLSYIMNLPIDILKIDKCFVDDITRNPKKELIMESIISLAQKINLEVVAEGIEVKEQYDILRKQNCDKIQGYYFSKPLSVEEAFEKLALEYYVSLSCKETASSID
ncbi:MAG: EAL domain-containing protein, partial [Clostridiaceae bacterium]